MVDRINPIIPRNPDVFPVPAVGLPRIDEREREERRRAREEEEREREAERRRAGARTRPDDGSGEDDGRPHIDVRA